MNKDLLERLAQLSKTKKHQQVLLPKRVVMNPPKRAVTQSPSYQPETHTMTIPSHGNDWLSRYQLNHEQRHGLQGLVDGAVGMQHKPPKWWAVIDTKIGFRNMRKWYEPANADPRIPKTLEAYLNLGATKQVASAAGIIAPNIMGAPLALWIIPQFIQQIKRQRNVREIYAKHGYDGILMMWAFPPKELDAIKLREWERQMVKKNLLSPDGGLTKIGQGFFGEKVNREFLYTQISNAQKRREHHKLKVE